MIVRNLAALAPPHSFCYEDEPVPMMTSQKAHSQLEPAHSPAEARTRNVRLPYGGPTGYGGPFRKGTVLGCAAGTVQSEVATLTLASTPSGTVTATFTGDKGYVVRHAYDATLAAVQALWEGVFGRGNVTVTGTPGSEYVLTFGDQLANTRIGGLFSASITSGSASWARTTRGSAGAGQFDQYVDAGTNNCPTAASAILAHDYFTNPRGGLSGPGPVS